MNIQAGLRILFVEDIPEDAEMAAYELKRAGLRFEHRLVDTKEDFLAVFPAFGPTLVISDYSMPRFDGMKALQLAREMDHNIPFIILTGSKNEETAVACLKAGASDYVIKSHMGRLPFAVREALDHARALAEREATLAALRESEESYRTLADSGQALSWTSDTERLRTWFNKPWLEFTGRGPEREKGDGWTAGVHPEDLRTCLEAFDRAFGRRERYSVEFRLLRRDGEYRRLQELGSPRYAANGSFIGYIGHCLDVTERAVAEERTRRALEEKEALLRELFHRTRNNMQVIMAILSFEADVARDDKVTRLVHETNDRIMSMSLVHRKLYESQDLSRIDLREYVDDLVSLLVQDPSFAGERVAVKVEVQPVSVLIDTAMPLALILNELLTNAFRHAFPEPRTGTVSVRLDKDPGGRINLEVADDGVGLPPGLDHLSCGTLGFQLVRGLVQEQIGGTMTMESNGGLACRVSFDEPEALKRV